MSAEDDARISTINDRVAKSMLFYENTARAHAKWYFSLSWVQIILAGLVPLFALSPNIQLLGYTFSNSLLAAISGGLVAIAKGGDSLHQFRPTWMRASVTDTRLRSERFLFETRSGAYATASDPISLYATNVDSILEGESQQWVQTASRESA